MQDFTLHTHSIGFDGKNTPAQVGRYFDRAECFATSRDVKNRLNVQKILDFRTKIH